MPMLFGKVVVGPDCGNVGPLLRHWNYPVFSVDSTNEVGHLVNMALKMEKDGIGIQNKQRQLDAYATNVIADKLYEVYIKISASERV